MSKSANASSDTIAVEMRDTVANAGDKLKGGAQKTGKAVNSLLNDFIAFLSRGSVVDLAVGIIIGAAFTAIVTSLVNDLITPLIGMATENSLENSFIVIKCKKNLNGTRDPLCEEGKQGIYNTIAAANLAGAVTWNWGRFVQTCINFLLISLIVFFLVKAYSAAFLRKKPAPTTKACEFCKEDIKLDAVKCKFCASVQSAADDSFLMSK
ncbi:hypothetical protein HDU67_006527 [Dinochytrium kinnereticum]|nr:hypothetical protein HDU67_006527 [Dinochytrium kinnereticum]